MVGLQPLPTYEPTAAAQFDNHRPYILRPRRAYLFRSVDNEVAAGVQRTLVELGQISVREARQQTVRGPEHNRNLTCNEPEQHEQQSDPPGPLVRGEFTALKHTSESAVRC